MKTINFILILALTCTSFSCSNDDDNTKTPNPSKNGFTFNSEFYSTDELFVTFDPESLHFLIVDNTSEFNSTKREFEGIPGQVITIGLPLILNGLTDATATFTHAVSSGDDEITDVSFVGALHQNITTIEPLLIGSGFNANETLLIANSGKVKLSYDSETETFTFEYTFITTQGTITGYHKSKVIIT